ncbi:MAG: hypothetical protein Q7R97_05380 [Candidatus Daviesbacteria bacterium]|nr:hypothetical protein [Candidatus Daviesbacteria bacterium]
MNYTPLRPKVIQYLLRHNLTKKFEKQIQLLLENPRHPSLHTELLEPHELGIRSFRINKSYRTLFIYDSENGNIKIVAITKHYQ